LLVTFVFGWGCPHLIWFVAHSNYQPWRRALTPLGLGAAVHIGQTVAYQLGEAMIAAVALRCPDEARVASIARVFRALPTLTLIWLISDVDYGWRLFSSWSGILRSESLPTGTRVNVILAAAIVEIFLTFAAAASVGVFYPVVLDEGRGPLAALSRAWRLMRGSRWRFLGLFLIYFAVEVAIDLPGYLIARSMTGTATLMIVQWATPALRNLADTLWSVAAVAGYVELREVKEGPPQMRTAEAFA
jgi:hypothetical protein